MTKTELAIENLSFRYTKKGSFVLQKVNFTAKEGDLIAVLGPNGVGKSTMFKCILGFFEKYDGNIFLDGTNLKDLSHKQIARRIAYIPQSTYPTFNYDVFDVVLMGLTSQLSLLSAPKEQHLAQARNVLNSLGIGHLAGAGYGEISGGERQLVLIARALVQNANILIMDEPTANLDYGTQNRVMCRVAELAKEGYIVILSTHNPDHAFLYANRVLMLENGKIIADGKPDDVLDADLIRRVYHINTRIETFDDENGIHRMCIPVNSSLK
ncbi:MAG TPA: ABC transporter ATP-binding protein [Methanocorpusculum sp.]|nr:ABC transporter ATP-binding protein [Methanocorpusculum sp.]